MVDYCKCKTKRVLYNGMQHKYECLACEREVSAVGMLSIGATVKKCEHNIPTNQACDSCYWNEAIEAAAQIADEDHGSHCEEVGNKIRKLKK